MNILTQADVQAKYGVSRQTVYDWRVNRGLPFNKFMNIIVFDPDVVEEWYRKYKTKK